MMVRVEGFEPSWPRRSTVGVCRFRHTRMGFGRSSRIRTTGPPLRPREAREQEHSASALCDRGVVDCLAENHHSSGMRNRTASRSDGRPEGARAQEVPESNALPLGHAP